MDIGNLLGTFIVAFTVIGATAVILVKLFGTSSIMWDAETAASLLPQDEPLEERLLMLSNAAERQRCIFLAALLTDASDRLELRKGIIKVLKQDIHLRTVDFTDDGKL